MRAWRAAAVFALLCGAAWAQENPEDDVRQHFDLVASRATAIFQAAGSIDERLKDQGATLHPQIVALRMRVDGAIREARVAMDKGANGRRRKRSQARGRPARQVRGQNGMELSYAVRHFLLGGRQPDRSDH